VSWYCDWNQLQETICNAIDTHIKQCYHVQLEEDPSLRAVRNSIYEELRRFTSAPFTIQRLSELAWKPPKYYRQPIKYLRAIERCVKIWSSQDYMEETLPILREREEEFDRRFFEIMSSLIQQGDPLLSISLDELSNYIREFTFHSDYDPMNVSMKEPFDEDEKGMGLNIEPLWN
jgi:hypothetical protein